MGAFIISDISFKTLKDRKKFENKCKKWIKILVDEKANSYGFGAWTFMRNPQLDVIYNMGFMGYGEPSEILRDCLKKKINITFWAWMPINDKDSHWEKIRGKWPR